MTPRSMIPQLTSQQAIALGESGWWHESTPEAIAAFQLSQDKLCMDFGAFHAAVEAVLGRSVWTHEFADPDRLWAELHGARPAPTFGEMLTQIPAHVRVLLVEVPDDPQ